MQEDNQLKERELPSESEEKKKEEPDNRSAFVKWMDSVPQRSCLLFMIAGLYLAYTGYRLCADVMKGNAAFGFAVGGALFLVIGVFLAFVGFRGQAKMRREQEAAEREEEKKEPPVEKRPMSISERARLSTSMEDSAEPSEAGAGDAGTAAPDGTEHSDADSASEKDA